MWFLFLVSSCEVAGCCVLQVWSAGKHIVMVWICFPHYHSLWIISHFRFQISKDNKYFFTDLDVDFMKNTLPFICVTHCFTWENELLYMSMDVSYCEKSWPYSQEMNMNKAGMMLSKAAHSSAFSCVCSTPPNRAEITNQLAPCIALHDVYVVDIWELCTVHECLWPMVTHKTCLHVGTSRHLCESLVKNNSSLKCYYKNTAL